MPPNREQADQQRSQERARGIQAMFGRLTPQYDRMNRVMTAGLDGRWRRQAVRAAQPQGAQVLDLGAGTGDLAREFRAAGAASVVGADFAAEMLQRARGKLGPHTADWLQADALRLPFADAAFDVVASAFVLRNLVDLPAGFAEMLRVLRPGGRLVALDITHPPDDLRGRVLRVGFERLVTPAAGLLSGDWSAYRYLPNSLAGYPSAEELSAMLRTAGADAPQYRRLAGGVVALHTARKAARPPFPIPPPSQGGG